MTSLVLAPMRSGRAMMTVGEGYAPPGGCGCAAAPRANCAGAIAKGGGLRECPPGSGGSSDDEDAMNFLSWFARPVAASVATRRRRWIVGSAALALVAAALALAVVL